MSYLRCWYLKLKQMPQIYSYMSDIAAYIYTKTKNLNNSTLLFLLAKVSTNLVHVRSVRLVYVKVFLSMQRALSSTCLGYVSYTNKFNTRYIKRLIRAYTVLCA